MAGDIGYAQVGPPPHWKNHMRIRAMDFKPCLAYIRLGVRDLDQPDVNETKLQFFVPSSGHLLSVQKM